MPPHVDHVTDDLAGFLGEVIPASGFSPARLTSPARFRQPHIGECHVHTDLAKTIDAAFEKRDGIGPTTKGPVREAVDAALELLDRGKARVAEKRRTGWTVNQWLKKAVLLSFRLNDMSAR